MGLVMCLNWIEEQYRKRFCCLLNRLQLAKETYFDFMIHCRYLLLCLWGYWVKWLILALFYSWTEIVKNGVY